jgi:endonuclease YncB( thermonuclease family)
MKFWQIFLLLVGGLATLGLIGIAALYVFGIIEPFTPTTPPAAAPQTAKELPTSVLNILATGSAATSTLAPTAESVTSLPINTFTAFPTGTSVPSLTPIQPGLPNPSQEFVSFSCITDQSPQKGIVSDVLDGDKIEVVLNGKAYPVRYIGISVPESAPYKDLSTQMNRSLVLGQTVALYVDKTDKDPEGNLPRYVLSGNIFVNYQLIRRGVVQTNKIPPDVSCSTLFEQAQTDAKTARLGIWKTSQSPTPPASITQPESTSYP